MPFLSATKVIAFTQETAQNTAIANAATDFLECYDFEGGPDSETLEMNPYRATLDRHSHVMGKKWQPLKFAIDIKGSGAAGTDYLPFSSILEACGFVKTVVATEGVQSVAVTGGGTGYTSASVLTFSGGGGTGAAGIPIVVGGAVVAIFITAPGTGYSTDPTPAVSVGSGATFTVTRGGAVAYQMTSAPASASYAGAGKSGTLRAYENASGILKVFNGTLLDPKFILEAGKLPKLELSGMAKYTAITDSAAFPTNTPNTLAPPKFEGVTLYAHTYAGVFSKLELGLNNEISERPGAGDATSIEGFQITGRSPGGSFDPEAVKVATHDFMGKFVSGAEDAIAFRWGSTAGNRFSVVMRKTQYGKVASADRNKIMAFQTPFVINQDTGDDCISILAY